MMLALALAGAERGFAAASASDQNLPLIAGVQVHICHSDAGDGSNPDQPSHHDCCDDCVLCAPVVLPAAIAFAEPVRAEHVARHAQGLDWAPIATRLRTPRQSQGPPAA